MYYDNRYIPFKKSLKKKQQNKNKWYQFEGKHEMEKNKVVETEQLLLENGKWKIKYTKSMQTEKFYEKS